MTLEVVQVGVVVLSGLFGEGGELGSDSRQPQGLGLPNAGNRVNRSYSQNNDLCHAREDGHSP